MGSYIELNDIEYNENDYDMILGAYRAFVKNMSLNELNEKIVFDFDIRSIIVKSYNPDVHINDNERENISEFKNICALVNQSLSNIREKNKHEPSTVRIASLFVYHIISIQPIKCFMYRKKDKTNLTAWLNLDMNAKFALDVAKFIFDEHNKLHKKNMGCTEQEQINKSKCDDCGFQCIDVDFLLNYDYIDDDLLSSHDRNRIDYKETMQFTLTYKTVSKAMIIQLFDYFDKANHRPKDKDMSKDDKSKNKKPTVKMQTIKNSNTFSLSNIDPKTVEKDFGDMLERDKGYTKKFIKDLFDRLEANNG